MIQAVALIIVGVALIVAAIVGLIQFLKSAYFNDPGPYASNSWEGYTKETFIGLVFFTFCPTLGFTLTLIGARVIASRARALWAAVIYAVVGFTSMAVGAAGLVWGRETLKCLGMFCLDMTKYVEIPNARPEAGIGWLSNIGITAFISLLPLGFMTVIHAYRTIRPTYTQISSSNRPVISARPGYTLHPVVIFALFAFVFVLGFVTLYFPNSWEYFVASRIAAKAVALSSADPNVCNTQWQVYSCPELEFAWFRTLNVKISSVLVLKTFPANVFFYVYLLCMIVIVGTLRASAKGRLFMTRHVGTIAGVSMSRGDVSFVAATTVMVMAFFFYWAHDHNYNGYWVGGPDLGVLASERIGRALGQLAVMFLSLLMFPASRWSVLHSLFGTTWEGSLWMHRVLGRLFTAAALAHMIAWYVMYKQKGLFPQDIIDIPMHLPSSIDNFTVPLNTLALWFSILCIGLTIEPVRRKYFEVFYYSHMVMAYTLIPAVLWHAAAGWEYLLPGLTVWFIDRCVRMWRSGFAVSVLSVNAMNGIVKVEFSNPTMVPEAGQYVFVNIPEISPLQWHPFTISSTTTSPHVSLHIRSMGPSTWTGRLGRHVQENGAVTLFVDGPYGRPFDAQNFRRVILVAGGIGITPIASIYGSLRHIGLPTDAKVALLWSVRETALVESFMPQFRDPPEGCRAVVFCTSSGCRVKSEPACTVQHRRIVPAEDFHEAFDEPLNPSDVLVFACGPKELVEIVGTAARKEGFAFHRETFLL